MLSQFSCTNDGAVCLTKATAPGFPRFEDMVCINCGKPMRYTGCNPDFTFEETRWRSWTGARWVTGPRPKERESLTETCSYQLF